MYDRKELLILSSLRQNSRRTLTNMSKQINLPISTIYDRLKGYQDDLITKHTSLLKFSSLGYHARATILIKASRLKKDCLRDYLLKSNSVNNFFKVNNGYDFLVEAIFKSVVDLDSFLECLDSDYEIEDKVVCYVIEDLKREAFLSSPEYVKLIYPC